MVHVNINRSIFSTLVNELREPSVLVLLGPRQVGKTTLLKALETEARQQNLRTAFFDLEQPSDLRQFSSGPQELVEFLSTQWDVIFIDEFYYLKNAGQIFKAVYDRTFQSPRPVKIIVSGSSSVQIHSHLKESLAGRTITYAISPLSFEEYSKWESPLRPSFSDYLRFGGLPGLSQVAGDDRKQLLLQEYLSAYLLKDIKGLVREENVRAFNQLLYFLAQNQGQLVEVSSLARELGMSATTIVRYLDVMEKTYVLFPLSSYHTNLANELKKSHKYYFYDLGIRNGLLKDFRHFENRPDKGQILESHVFLCLRRQLKPNMELKFWRTKRQEEVDFILLRDRQPIPIEVKSTLLGQVPPGIRAFCRRYPQTPMSISVGEGKADMINEKGTNHLFLPFSELSQIASKFSRPPVC